MTGRPVHCVELNSGQAFTGFLFLSNTEVSLQLLGYGNIPPLNLAAPIYVRTEEGKVASLFNTVFGGYGGNVGVASHETVFHVKYHANMVIIGSDKWQPEEKVKSVTFYMPGTDLILYDATIIDNIKTKPELQQEDTKIFQIKTDKLTIFANYELEPSYTSLDGRNVRPSISIEFSDGVTLDEYYGFIYRCVSFFSFCLCRDVRPTDIKISRDSAEERKVNLENGIVSRVHQVRYLWPERADLNEPSNGNSWFASNFSTVEKVHFAACLKHWIEGATDWQKAQELMVVSLRMQSKYTSERLLAACKCLEEIPNAKSMESMTLLQKNKLACHSKKEAEQLGLDPELAHRIEQAILNVKGESHRIRFKRLIMEIKSAFGEDIFPLKILDHLMDAQKFRGRSAHGHFDPISETHHLSFFLATSAMETLCFLLLAKELPYSLTNYERVRAYDLVQHYKFQSL